MTTFNYWTIVGPTMILASFMIGWLRNRKHYCVIEPKRSDTIQRSHMWVFAPIFTGMTVAESFYGCLQFWRDCLPQWLSWADVVLTVASFVAVLAASFFILKFVAQIGERSGENYVRKSTAAFRKECASGITCAANCPRACKGCPNKGIIHLEELIVDEDGISVLRHSANPRKSANLAYCVKVYNSNTHQYMYSTRNREPGARYHRFTQMPMRNCTASEFQPVRRQNDFVFPTFDATETSDKKQGTSSMPPLNIGSRRVSVTATVKRANGDAAMLGFSGPEDSDIIRGAAASLAGNLTGSAEVCIANEATCG